MVRKFEKENPKVSFMGKGDRVHRYPVFSSSFAFPKHTQLDGKNHSAFNSSPRVEVIRGNYFSTESMVCLSLAERSVFFFLFSGVKFLILPKVVPLLGKKVSL